MALEQVKLLYKDIECMFCHAKVNRRTAERDDWKEVIEVDFSGMARERMGYCCNEKVCRNKLYKEVQADERTRS